MKLFESLVENITMSIRIRLLTVLLRMISGFRILLLFLVGLIVFATVSIGSAFTGLVYAIHQYGLNGFVVFDGTIVFCIIVFFVFSVLSTIFLLLMREDNWLSTLKINEMIEAIMKNK